MANKVVRRFFSEFKGLNLGRTHLNRDAAEATVMTNVERNYKGDIEGRVGCKPAAQFYPTPATAYTRGCRYPMWGVERYAYTDPETGEAKQELIGIGNGLFKLQSGTLTISYTGADAVTFSFLPSGAATWVATLKKNGATSSGFPFNCYSAIFSAATPTLAQLRNAINSISGMAAYLTPGAVVNGNQTCGYTGLGTAGWALTSVTVYNANTATTQVNTISISTTEQKRVELHDRSAGALGRQFYDVTASSGTTLQLRPNGHAFGVNALDEIGAGLYPACILPITEETSIPSGSSITLNFTFWERVYQPGYKYGTFSHLETLSYFMPDSRQFNADSHNFSIKSDSNVAFVGVPWKLGSEGYNYTYDLNTGSPVTETFTVPPRESGLIKYDGQSVFQAGLPRIDQAELSLSAGSELEIGLYKYLIRWKSTDEKGNVVYSTDTSEWGGKVLLEIETTSGNQQVDLLLPSLTAYGCDVPPNAYADKERTWAPNTNGAKVQTTSLGTNIILVTPIDTSLRFGPAIRVGDTVRISQYATSDNTPVVRKVTAVTFATPTSAAITVDGDPIDVTAGSPISTALTIEIFRTKAFGNSYYLVSEIPMDTWSGSATTSFIDDVADKNLGYEYDGPFTGANRKDPPPICGILETHQGLLTTAGDPNSPNTASWSNDSSNETFPLQNSIDLPASRSGVVSAIASDNVNTLAVFKADAYFGIIGDLLYGGISLADSAHGDVGCPSPFSAAKVRSYLLCLSGKGPRMLKDGQFLPADDRLAEIFQNNAYRQVNGEAISALNEDKIVLGRSVSFHDEEGQRVFFSLPFEAGTPGSETFGASAFGVVYDYSSDLWWVFSPAGGYGVHGGVINMLGGGARIYDKLYFQSRGSAGKAFLFEFNNSGTKYDFCDDGYAILQTYAPQWDSLNTPSLDKVATELRVYSLYGTGDYGPDDTFYPHTLDLTFYKNFKTTSFGGKSLSLTTAPADGGVTMSLPLNKVRSFQPVFACGTAFGRMRISGYEVLYAVPFKEETLMP